MGYNLDDPDLSFTIHAITPDGQCTSEYAQKPENGHFVILKITAKTSTRTQQQLMIIPNDFAVVGADGVTETALTSGPANGCLKNADRFPPQVLAAGSQYTGALVLDSKSNHGVLTFRPSGLQDNGGWEWAF
jgi:hypothetical protein